MSQLQLPTIVQVLTGDSSQLTAAYRQAAEAGRAFAGQARQIEDQLNSLSCVQSAGINLGFDQKSLDNARAMVGAIRELEQVQSRRLTAPPAALQNEATITRQITELTRERFRLEGQMRSSMAAGDPAPILQAQEAAWRRINQEVGTLTGQLHRLPEITRAATAVQTAFARGSVFGGGTVGATSEQLAAFGLGSRAPGTVGATPSQLATLRDLQDRAAAANGQTVGATQQQVAAVRSLLGLKERELTAGRQLAEFAREENRLTRTLVSLRGEALRNQAMANSPAQAALNNLRSLQASAGAAPGGLLANRPVPVLQAAPGGGGGGGLGPAASFGLTSMAGFFGGHASSMAFGALIGGPAGLGIAGIVAGLGIAVKGVETAFNLVAAAAKFTFSTIASGAQAALGVISDLTVHAVKLGAEYEKAKIVFEVLAGGAEKGGKLFADVQKLALQTPFTTRGLAQEAQQLLGFGVGVENILPVLSRLGDISLGDADRLQRLALAFGEVLAEGKLSGIRVRQFATTGVGVQDFAKTMGVDTARFRDLLHTNQVGADVVVQTINRLTSPGGRFFQQSQRGMETVLGQWTNLIEKLELLGGQIGSTLFKDFNIAGYVALLTEGIDKVAPGITAAARTFFQGVKVVAEEVFAVLEAGWAAAGKAYADVVSSLMGSQPTWEDFRKLIRQLIDTFIELGAIVARVMATIVSLTIDAMTLIATSVKEVALLVAKLSNVMPVGGAAVRSIALAVGGEAARIEARLQSPQVQAINQALQGLPAGVTNFVGNLQKGLGDARGLVGEPGIAKVGGFTLAGGLVTPDTEFKRRAMEAFPGEVKGGVGGGVGKPPPRIMLPGVGGFAPAPGGFAEGGEGKGGAGPTDIGLKIGGTAGEAMARSMERNFDPGKIQMSVGISSEARTLLNHTIDQMEKGLTPFAQYQTQQKLFDEILRGPKMPGELVHPGFGRGDIFLGATPEQARAVGIGRAESFLKLQDHLKGFRPEDNLPQAALRGTAEAQDIINKGQYAQTDVMQDVLGTLRLGQRLDEDRNNYLRDVLQALNDLGNNGNLPQPAGVK